jgi:Zn-dependent protease with chaperone function
MISSNADVTTPGAASPGRWPDAAGPPCAPRRTTTDPELRPFSMTRYAVRQTISTPVRRILALGAALIAPAVTLHAGDPGRATGHITRYDIATRDDLLLSHLVAPAMVGDIEQWSRQLLGGLPGQVGDWVSQFLDATAMANLITQAFPVEGQPALRPVDDLVADCAAILGVAKPDVYVRNSPQTLIYTVQAGGRSYLVLTGALLNLFEGRPDELRFVVGRELGHNHNHR